MSGLRKKATEHRKCNKQIMQRFSEIIANEISFLTILVIQ